MLKGLRLATGVLLVGLGGMVGCSSKAPVKLETPQAKAPAYEDTPMPTVPPRTATPPPSVTPAPSAAAGSKTSAAGSNRPTGPVITWIGGARADGMVTNPLSVDKSGVPTYQASAGSGFILVVEAKPGISGIDVGRNIFLHSDSDPTMQPDLQIISNRDLGNGSKEVCDRRKPNPGGVPAVNPPVFAETQQVSDAMNDLGCRFETFIESESGCTVDKLGNFAFASKETTAQFCTIVARSFAFPIGTTEIQVRLRDTAGNFGPVKKLRLYRPDPAAVPKKKAAPASSDKGATKATKP